MPFVIEPPPSPSPPTPGVVVGTDSGGGRVPKLRVPLEMGTEGLRTVEQDSEDEIAACVYAIAATPLGHRIDDLNFGVEDPTFDQLPVDDAELLEQVGRYEPRAEVQTGQEITDLIDQMTAGVEAP